MPEGAPKYTPEQIAELEKSRTISDAELLKGGAKYVVDNDKNTTLHPSREQKKFLSEESTVGVERKIEGITELNNKLSKAKIWEFEKIKADFWRKVLQEITGIADSEKNLRTKIRS